jgi:hypothetical protein
LRGASKRARELEAELEAIQQKLRLAWAEGEKLASTQAELKATVVAKEAAEAKALHADKNLAELTRRLGEADTRIQKLEKELAAAKKAAAAVGDFAKVRINLAVGRRDPVSDFDVVFDFPRERALVQTHGEDGDSALHGGIDLAKNVLRIICVRGEQKNQNTGSLESVGDGASPSLSRLDVARADPCGEPVGLQSAADFLGNRGVLAAVRNENVPAGGSYLGGCGHGRSGRLAKFRENPVGLIPQ